MQCSTADATLQLPTIQKSVAFDGLYGEAASQEDIFEGAKPFFDAFLEGYNVRWSTRCCTVGARTGW